MKLAQQILESVFGISWPNQKLSTSVVHFCLFHFCGLGLGAPVLPFFF